MSARDGAARLLSAAVWLLPPARRDWGRAMRAELVAVTARRDRWTFAAGCTGAVLRQPVVLRSLVYSIVMVGALAGVVVWSAGIVNPALRWDAVMLVAGLVAVSWLGRVAGPLGPVGAAGSARTVRGFGSLAVAVAALGVVAGMNQIGQNQEAEQVVPVLGAILVGYLAGFVAVTADRSPATARTLWAAGGAAVGGALLWLARAVLAPPIPASAGFAAALLVCAMGIAAFLTRGQPSRRVVGALTAGAGLTLLVLIEVVLLSSYAPARMIPDLAPAALTPADDLAQSRSELQDPYVALMFLGALIALALGITSVALRRRAAGPMTSR
ncbi:hypothetical protein [Dactylosporangium sp. NPDC049140]|uniref:hypothetical protein n=1 Tax=Dactylosporangium sp. NPDC049140 TaxID=3155647 RepID=UPI00340A8AF1